MIPSLFNCLGPRCLHPYVWAFILDSSGTWIFSDRVSGYVECEVQLNRVLTCRPAAKHGVASWEQVAILSFLAVTGVALGGGLSHQTGEEGTRGQSKMPTVLLVFRVRFHSGVNSLWGLRESSQPDSQWHSALFVSMTANSHVVALPSTLRFGTIQGNSAVF